jgi:hypothetical protein
MMLMAVDASGCVSAKYCEGWGMKRLKLIDGAWRRRRALEVRDGPKIAAKSQ